jgi:raffinose/stachyose/melibiose transport system permease protein
MSIANLSALGQAATSPAQPPRRRHLPWSEVTTIVLFLAPAVGLFVVFMVAPVLYAAFVSFFSWKGFGPPKDFIGLQNYAKILQDTVFMKATIHGGTILLLSVLVQLPLALGLALLVGRDLPGRAVFRTIFFMPYVLAEVSTAAIWRFTLEADPQTGLVNAVIRLLGLKTVPWLGSLDTVMFAIFIALTWKYFGYHMLLYLAGLQNIPAEVEEAAKIDGASGLQTLRYITIPLLGPTIRLTVYLSVLGSLQQFTTVQLMTKGGPAYASEMPVTYMYNFGFIRFSYGYAAAAAMLLFVVCYIFSVLYQRFVMQQDVAGAVE